MVTESEAASYFGAMSSLAGRVVSEQGVSWAEGPFGDYFRARAKPPRDPFAGPFSFRTRSQTDLFFEVEIGRAPELHELDKDLVLSHCKVLSELKTALKFDKLDKRPQDEEPPRQQQQQQPKKEEGNFISKLIHARKAKTGDDRERLVASEKRCQIVASSDNHFKTDFRISTAEETEDDRPAKSLHGHYKSVSGLEEARALLANGSLQDSLGASTDSDFLSCEDTPASATSPLSSTFILPKTGYDFLDNW